MSIFQTPAATLASLPIKGSDTPPPDGEAQTYLLKAWCLAQLLKLRLHILKRSPTD
jgi:hypothetical protein